MNLLNRLFGEREEYSIRHNGHEIKIYSVPNGRVLRYDGVVYSRLYEDTPYTYEYWDFFMPLGGIKPDEHMLMIGLGGGTIVRMITNKFSEVTFDVVEVDRVMADVTKKFIGEELRCNILFRDGAEYVKSSFAKYDVIILDAFISDRIPEEFLERDFVAAAYAGLKEEGILAINCISSMDGSLSIGEYTERLSEFFDVYRLETGFITANTLLICTKALEKQELIGYMLDRIRFEDNETYIRKAYEQMKLIRKKE